MGDDLRDERLRRVTRLDEIVIATTTNATDDPIVALASPPGWPALLVPVFLLYLLFKVTGIPETEAQALRSRGDDYRRYQDEVSVFVPLPPRRRTRFFSDSHSSSARGRGVATSTWSSTEGSPVRVSRIAFMSRFHLNGHVVA